ncbi:MAG: RNA polymerase sigma factor [Pirellulales bacterium]
MTDWDDLVCREGPAVWRTAYRLIGNQADADECFQETFLAALELSQRQPVRNWPALLQRLATTRAVDRIRSRMRRRRSEEVADVASAVGSEPDPAEQIESKELVEALRWAVAQLPARQAEAFCLHEFADWSFEQVAEQLGTTVNAATVLLHRARQKLQELLKMQNCLSAALDEQRPIRE